MIKFHEKSDPVGGLIWLVLGVCFCIGSIKFRLGNFEKPGPGFMPFISGALLGLFGLILMVSSIVQRLRVEEEQDDKEAWVKENRKKVVLILIALFGYGFLLELLGFLVTTFIFLFFLFKLTEPKRWAMPLVISGITVILSYLFFAIWLKSSFPRGILGF